MKQRNYIFFFLLIAFFALGITPRQFIAPPQTINSYFDPQVEFLELEVSTDARTVQKLYGPDLNGVYGGENGTGGLDAVSPYLNLFDPVISDARGNILAEVTNGVVSWNPSRPTGYGAVPGYRPVAFDNGADMAQSSAWRGREVDVTGLYNLGVRTYDPVSGMWLSFDPMWNVCDPNGYTFSAGDPVNYFDPDGRLSKEFYQTTAQQLTTANDWASDQIINMVAGTGALMQQAAGKATELLGGDPGNLYWQANHYQSWTSPFARAGAYNPNLPLAQAATASTVLIAPESLAGRVGTFESAATRQIATTTATREVSAVVVATKTETTTLAKFYPQNNGFLGTTEGKLLMPGEKIDRYGGNGYSRFFSPAGTPEMARALPPGTVGQQLRTFEVVKPFEVQAGTVAPAFGELGFGQQYVTPIQLEILLKRGIIKEIK